MKRIIFIFILYLGIAAESVHAQGSWAPFVTNLAGSPPEAASFLNEKFGFVETAGNWYRTTDGGKKWALTHGLGVQGLVHLNFFYNTPGDIIVNGAFESIDSGLTWQKLGNPSISESFYEKDSTLYDADGSLSFDHTNSWRQIMGYSGGEAVVGNMDKGIAMWGGQTFGFPPGSTLYTTDGGYTWHIGQAGVEADFGYAFPFTLTYLRAGGDGNDAIQRTTDGGATWKNVYLLLQHSWYFTDGIKGDGCVVFVQTDTTHISPAGVLRSTDQGVTWVGIGGPTCTDDAPICGVASRGAVCFAMDYFSNGKNTLWKFTDPSLLRPVLSDMTIDRLFPDTVFMNSCDTTEIKVKVGFSACDFIRFHGLWIDSLSAQNYRSYFTLNNILRTGFPDSGTISIFPNAPGIYHLLMHINVAGSDWSGSDTTLPFVLVVKGHPPTLTVTVNDTVNFGTTPICFSGGMDSLLLSDPSCESLTVTAVRFEGDSAGQNAYTVSMAVPYDIVHGSPDGKITILYHPKSAGIKTGKIIIVTTVGTDTIPVYANALPDTAKLTVTKNTLIDFGTQPLCAAGGKDTVFLSDSSCISLRVGSVLFVADSSPSSEFTVGAVTPYDLQFGKPAGRFILIFHPLTSGVKTGKIIIVTSIGSDTIPVYANILPDGRTLAFNSNSIEAPICDSTEGLVTIHNLSCRQMSIDTLTLAPPFSLLPKQLPVVINSGDSAVLRIRFAPSIRGVQQIPGIAALRLYLPNGSVAFDTTLTLTGFGLRGTSAYSLSNAGIAFDSVSLCDSAVQKIVLHSTGCDSLTVNRISISGDPEFHLSSFILPPSSFASGDSLVLDVNLIPSNAGNKNGLVTIELNDSTKITLLLSATVIPGGSVLSTSLNVVDFGTTTMCDEKDTVITIENKGCSALIISGIAGLGQGFGSNTSFPITITPGKSATIDIFTLLDTAGGKTASTGTLTFSSNSLGNIAPITLHRSYISGAPRDLGLYLDNATHAATDLGTVSYDIKETAGRSFTGAGIRQINFDLDYNTDLLDFDIINSTAGLTTTDGKSFVLINSSEIHADANSILATIGFRVYLTKDSTTTITLANVTIDSNHAPCSTTILSYSGSAAFDYNFLCGERSVSGFLRGVMPLKIIALRPNPAQDQIEIDLRSAEQQDANVEILNTFGANVFSDVRNITTGSNSICLDTRSLSSGVYLIRIGSASQSFVKVK